MNVFVTADTHFGDEEALQCRRQWGSVEEMDESLIVNWNADVKSGDFVIVVGDLAVRRHLHYLGVLNGKKILIRGHCDLLSRDSAAHFEEIHDVVEKKVGDRSVVFSHFPLQTWSSEAIHIHGHTHGQTLEQPGRLDVGCDVWGYRPVHWDVISEKLKDQEGLSGLSLMLSNRQRNLEVASRFSREDSVGLVPPHFNRSILELAASKNDEELVRLSEAYREDFCIAKDQGWSQALIEQIKVHERGLWNRLGNLHSGRRG